MTTYEQAIKRLNTIVTKMENGEMNVDSLATNLQEAKKLVAFCRQKLTDVEAEVQKIFDENAGPADEHS